jgi:hypothetical protein
MNSGTPLWPATYGSLAISALENHTSALACLRPLLCAVATDWARRAWSSALSCRPRSGTSKISANWLMPL